MSEEPLVTPFICMYRIVSDGDEIFVLVSEHPDPEKAREAFRRHLRKRGLTIRWGKKETAEKSLIVTVDYRNIPPGSKYDLTEVNTDG